MSEAASEEKAWPPREGMRFFLLWMGGTIVCVLLGRGVLWAGGSLPPGSAGLASFSLAFALVQSGWQAWLLFAGRLRRFGWVALALVLSGVQLWLLSLRGYSLPWPEVAALLFPLFQTVLLVGARRRPWLWLVAGALSLVLGHGGQWVIFNPGQHWAEWFVAQLPVPISATAVQISALQGVWLLGEMAAAAALAWWMPPPPPRSAA